MKCKNEIHVYWLVNAFDTIELKRLVEPSRALLTKLKVNWMICSACKKSRPASSEKLWNSLEKNQNQPPQKTSLVFLLPFLWILRWVAIYSCYYVDGSLHRLFVTSRCLPEEKLCEEEARSRSRLCSVLKRKRHVFFFTKKRIKTM